MCGIAGILKPCASEAELTRAVAVMAQAISHRGPDDSGTWADPQAGVALGHRRLSIVDLSCAGHQPMTAASGRYVVTFNGEIYNFRALRSELTGLGAQFRGHCDTEVMVAAIDHWGVRSACERFNGMFAFAVWDRRERRLTLACDRMGEKPLYYGWRGAGFVFASQLSALRELGGAPERVNPEALSLYLRYGYVPAPLSILKGIEKLGPATMVSIDPATATSTPTEYWSLSAAATAGLRRPAERTPAATVDVLNDLIEDSIALRTEADVPLGAFLSGGVDSSTVVAIMQSRSSHPVTTFTVGFHETAFNEAPEAAAVARALGTDHHELYVSATDAIDVIPELSRVFDEPFCDPSQIPMLLVSRLARQHVTVAMSGDGGDELFGGYDRYFWTERMWRLMRVLPPRIRALASIAVQAGPSRRYAALIAGAQRFGLFAGVDPRQAADRLLKLAELAAAPDVRSLYHAIISFWAAPPVYGVTAPETLSGLLQTLPSDTTSWDSRSYFDMVSYLPGDVLTKLDRTTMSVGLEGRVPLLDHRLVEEAWRIPASVKRLDGRGKWPLRQVMQRYLPQSLTDRPKQSFGLAFGDWLRGPLRDWAEALLDPQCSLAGEHLDLSAVRRTWHEHLSGERDRSFQIWSVLMFESWLRGPLAATPAMNPL